MYCSVAGLFVLLQFEEERAELQVVSFLVARSLSFAVTYLAVHPLTESITSRKLLVVRCISDRISQISYRLH